MGASRIYRDEIFLALTRQCREKTANIPCELRPPYLDKFLWELAFMVGVCLRSQAWQMATYRCMPNNLCCPASIKVRESALALDTSPALKTKSKREGRSHGFFFLFFFSFCSWWLTTKFCPKWLPYGENYELASLWGWFKQQAFQILPYAYDSPPYDKRQW